MDGELFITTSIEYLITATFYGLAFGVLAGFIRPLYHWFRSI